MYSFKLSYRCDIGQGICSTYTLQWSHNEPIPYGEVWYTMNDSKSYCTRKMAVYQSRTVHSNTRRACLIHTRNIGPIRLLPSKRSCPSIEPFLNGEIWNAMNDPTNRWVQYLCGKADPVGIGMYRTWLARSHFPGTVALWIIHVISDVPLGKVSIKVMV